MRYREREKERYPTLFTYPVIKKFGEDVVSFIKYSNVHLCANVKLVFS